ncbi:hypothetical protein [Methylobacterium iners]|uniref:Uncharacterized protein n=1 Tax=Methylobacterium iners TaxID=418707 RepID=A0ABQ4S097_9HYPH|nr:hypothetical protein [Methylobacterium iners]GJD96371.1 hypothetical protein OCOJLMKI_3592 [Methylobacterium iners]
MRKVASRLVPFLCLLSFVARLVASMGLMPTGGAASVTALNAIGSLGGRHLYRRPIGAAGRAVAR